jgi:hypothetical protein
VLAEDRATLVGIADGFSIPLRYFEVHRLKPDWSAFLDDFKHHWPTDDDHTDDHTYVDFFRDGLHGNGAARMGNPRWRRLTEERAGSAKSVFHFDVQGSVAKSTHAGIPWLRFIRQRLGARVHFWPFDGWNIPAGAQRWWRSIRRYGAVTSRARNATAISTTHIRPPRGCAAPISTGALPRFSLRRLPRPSARWHRSKGGSSE